MSIIWCKTVDSTNKEARRLIGAGLLSDKLSVVATEEQTCGKGQGDHIWESEPGKNLLFSIIVDLKDGPALEASREQVINEWICPVICSFLEDEGVHPWVKQPNDIWIGDKKICGILVENILRGKFLEYSIIGIGLNLNQEVFPEHLPNPVSLKQLTGKEYKPGTVLSGLVGKFRKKNFGK